MESDVTRHLRLLREFLDRIVAAYKYKYPVYATEPDSKILEEVAATAAPGGMSEIAVRLIKKLENVGKTSRMINERFPSMTFSSEDEERLAKYFEEEEQDIFALASTDEDKGSEAIQQQENLASTDEDKTGECAQDQESADHTSSDEGKDKRSFGEMPFRPGDSETLSKERKTFLIQMNVSNFSSKEVEVNVREKYLEIHSKHDKLIDEHGIISREFTRKFDIPKDVDPETFRALYDCYGVLHVEASFMPDNTKCREVDIFLDEETGRQHDLESLEDLGKEFEELAERYIKDGSDMAEFARNLIKQYPSDYIPMEEVIIP